jgi:DNA-binding MurR/RpiR family transcriptional regulator
MKGHGTKFGRKMEAAVTALITQRNLEEAARAVGISVATLVRWQRDPGFQKAYREARRATHQQSVARLQQATGAAVTMLLKVLVDPSTPASVKVRAAESVLEHSAKAIELEDIEVRVAELELAAEMAKAESMRRVRQRRLKVLEAPAPIELEA